MSRNSGVSVRVIFRLGEEGDASGNFKGDRGSLFRHQTEEHVGLQAVHKERGGSVVRSLRNTDYTQTPAGALCD